MKKVIITFQWIFIALLVITLFFWLMAQGSSHEIPMKTNIQIRITGFVLAALLVTAEFIKRKIN